MFLTHSSLLSDIQINGVEEDRLAKPHRPIPSGRISPRAATLLYRVLFAAMWAAAVSAKTIPCTLTYSVAIVVYNEGGWAAVPVVKNVLGAALAVFLVGAIFATTGYAQDFRDRSADKMMGRRTIPLLLPQPVARWSLAASITAWTVGLLALWRPPVVAGIAFAAAGLTCLGGFLRSYEEEDDYVSYCWFGVSGTRFWEMTGGGEIILTFEQIARQSCHNYKILKESPRSTGAGGEGRLRFAAALATFGQIVMNKQKV
ncbi:MAG: hypothetical protein LQ344_004086 [Seirophora lacunosa]|nr:MAG: hypothetical protein LQ344_004086 [Seirophora lacunosa]